MISLDDLKVLEQHEEKQGLAAIAGKWQDFDEEVDAMGEIKCYERTVGKDAMYLFDTDTITNIVKPRPFKL